MFRILAVAITLVLNGCAHYPDVRPGADGVHSVKIKSESPESGSREAISQARSYCKSLEKTPAIVSENSSYTGEMDEGTYKTAKKVSRAAETIGPAIWTMGGKRESRAGGTVGVAGAAGDQILGEEYSVQMTFKCQ